MRFVSQSEIVVSPEQQEALEAAFRSRARLVDAHAGFLGLELLKDVRGQGRYVLLTRWASRSDFLAYMRSGDHAAAHRRLHPGLDSDTAGGKLQQFEVVMSEENRESVQP